MTEGLLAGHEREPGGCALGHDVEVVKLDTARREGIDHRRFNICRTVRAHPFLAEIIEQNEQNIGAIVGALGRNGKTGACDNRSGQKESGEILHREKFAG